MTDPAVCELIQIFRASYTAALSANVTHNAVSYDSNLGMLTIKGQKYYVQSKDIYIIGAGKAVQNIARTLENILGSKIKGGIVSIPTGTLNSSAKTNVCYCEGAENNRVDKNAENTARMIKCLVKKLGKDDFVIFLVSGGASELLPLPKESITLEEKIEVLRKLADVNAKKNEIDVIRRKLSDLKGGQLARYARPAHIVSLIVRDINDHSLEYVGREGNSQEALRIINKYNLYNDLPESVKNIINRYGDNLQGAPSSNDSDREINNNDDPETVTIHVIGSNINSFIAAANEAKILQYMPVKISHFITGNVEHIANKYITITLDFCKLIKWKIPGSCVQDKIINRLRIPVTYDIEKSLTHKPDTVKGLCLILGGRTTVNVEGTGKGGNNQHLALEYSRLLHEIKKDIEQDFDIYFLSAATDGLDGPTEAAGAIGYLNLVTDSEQQNLQVDEYINNYDSYNFYQQLKNGIFHVFTGLTDTNVMDVHLIIIKNKQASQKNGVSGEAVCLPISRI